MLQVRILLCYWMPGSSFQDTKYVVGDYRIEECPIPDIGEEEVLVKVLAVGVCSSDAKCFAGAAYYWGESGGWTVWASTPPMLVLLLHC